jgi:hypothetical protein
VSNIAQDDKVSGVSKGNKQRQKADFCGMTTKRNKQLKETSNDNGAMRLATPVDDESSELTRKSDSSYCDVLKRF